MLDQVLELRERQVDRYCTEHREYSGGNVLPPTPAACGVQRKAGDEKHQ
jgi:hypothetical protein